MSKKVLNPRPNTSVVAAGRQHLPDIVACHFAAFPMHLPTLLGRRFLRGMYAFSIKQPESICLVALDGTTGFVSGVLMAGRPGLRRQYVLKSLPFIVLTFLYKAILHSYARQRIMDICRKSHCRLSRMFHLCPPETDNPGYPEEPQGKWYLLYYICTHPAFLRRGVAKALLEAFRTEAARRGCRVVRLTVANDNIPAMSLYKKLRWNAVGTDGTLTYFHLDVEQPAQPL